MPNCAIKNCKNATAGNFRVNLKTDISFHRFPHEPELKEKWIDATGNKDWFPTKYSTICSIHFSEACFVGGKKRRLLTKSAFPTIDILKSTTSYGERATVRRWVRRAATEGSVEDRPRAHPPRILTQANESALVKYYRAHPTTKIVTLAERYKCSVQTIRSALHRAGVVLKPPTAKKMVLPNFKKEVEELEVEVEIKTEPPENNEVYVPFVVVEGQTHNSLKEQESNPEPVQCHERNHFVVNCPNCDFQFGVFQREATDATEMRSPKEADLQKKLADKTKKVVSLTKSNKILKNKLKRLMTELKEKEQKINKVEIELRMDTSDQ